MQTNATENSFENSTLQQLDYDITPLKRNQVCGNFHWYMTYVPITLDVNMFRYDSRLFCGWVYNPYYIYMGRNSPPTTYCTIHRPTTINLHESIHCKYFRYDCYGRLLSIEQYGYWNGKFKANPMNGPARVAYEELTSWCDAQLLDWCERFYPTSILA